MAATTTAGTAAASAAASSAAATAATTAGTAIPAATTAGIVVPAAATTAWNTGMAAGSAAATTAGAAGTATTGYTLSSLLGDVLTGASAVSSIMGGIQTYHQMKASARQSELQAGQEKLKATQQSNLIRENMLKEVASANAMFGARGILSAGSPEQVIRESANQANQDISITQANGRLAYLQHKAQANEYKQGAAYSLLNGVGNAAFTVSNSKTMNRILNK